MNDMKVFSIGKIVNDIGEQYRKNDVEDDFILFNKISMFIHNDHVLLCLYSNIILH